MNTKRFAALAGLLMAVASASNLHSQQPGAWRMTDSLLTWDGPDNGGWTEYAPTATLLKNGNVLFVGGNGAEIYDPGAGRWSPGGNLIKPRYGHIAVRLANGKVLVAGGYDPPLLSFSKRTLSSAEIYDPVDGTWSSAGNLTVAREGHTAELLADGTVLVIGGTEQFQVTHSSAEIYDPSTGVWSPAGMMPSPHTGHASTVLANGNVLVIGGNDQPARLGNAREAALFDLATRTWTATGSLTTPRVNPRATLLRDGRVLVTGGSDRTRPISAAQGVYPSLETAELYDPVTGQWSATGSMTEGRAIHTQTLLPNGKVLVAGGQMGRGRTFYDVNFDYVIAVSDTAELYDPVTGQWSATASMNVFRYGHRATLLANGKVLVAGGWVFGGNRRAAELYEDLPVLTLGSTSYCIGASWSLSVQSLAPNSSIRLVGTSNDKWWEVVDWGKTNDQGNYSETGAFPPGTEGAHTLYVDIAGRVSNEVSFSVRRCENN